MIRHLTFDFIRQMLKNLAAKTKRTKGALTSPLQWAYRLFS
jgi:hypothetical protein